MTASPATSTTSTKRQSQTVTHHRLASHPVVTGLAASIATAMQITDTGEPGNRMTMPRIENQAAAPAKPTATT
jgi:hypothetical protein